MNKSIDSEFFPTAARFRRFHEEITYAGISERKDPNLTASLLIYHELNQISNILSHIADAVERKF